MKIWTALMSATACSMLLGCGTEPVEEDGDESVGEADLGIGEAACATETADDTYSSGSYCGEAGVTSPNTSYNHTNCPGQFIVEFSGTGIDNIATFGHGWGDTLPSTEASCVKARHYVSVYFYDGSSWTQIENGHNAWGVWQNGACEFDPPDTIPDPDATKYRVVTRAIQCPVFGLCTSPTVKKARSSVTGIPCL